MDERLCIGLLILCICMVSLFIVYKNKKGQQTKTVKKNTFKKDIVKKILITQYYIPKWEERQDEIDETLINNLNNNLIDEIHLFIEKNYDFTKFKSNPYFNKLVFVKSKDRLSFKQAFEYSNKHCSKNDIIILANSDIYFNGTLSKIDNYLFNKTFFALSRHEITIDGLILKTSSDSQDVWIWKLPIHINKSSENIDYFKDGIQLGIGGCDNRILGIMKNEGYTIRNIGRHIQCIHNHKNDLRTWMTDQYELSKRYNIYDKLYFIEPE